MSQENAEIARRACVAAWRRPKPDFDALNALAHPDHEMFTIQSLVEGGSGYRGAEGFRRWLTSWNDMFGEDWEASVEEAEPVDDERVFVTGWMNARGSGGGVPVEQRFWLLMNVRDGKVSRSEVYTDRNRALGAAGLRE
jgi:ketosteroid isomerase-like protein